MEQFAGASKKFGPKKQGEMGGEQRVRIRIRVRVRVLLKNIYHVLSMGM